MRQSFRSNSKSTTNQNRIHSPLITWTVNIAPAGPWQGPLVILAISTPKIRPPWTRSCVIASFASSIPPAPPVSNLCSPAVAWSSVRIASIQRAVAATTTVNGITVHAKWLAARWAKWLLSSRITTRSCRMANEPFRSNYPASRVHSSK